MSVSRRAFLQLVSGGSASLALTATLGAQQANTGTANVPMDEARYLPVRLPPRSSQPSMNTLQRDALERRIHCQCGCNLDVFTCRTTDFSCQVSPAMHKDVMALVAGGYSAQEIIDAFTKVYGPRVLMEPPRRGFNLAGYFTPSVVLLAGIALVIVLIRRWHRPPELDAGVRQLPVDASPDELDRLQRLVKRDDA